MSDYPPGLQNRPYPYHVKTTADHWWPKGMQRLWPDLEGYVSCIDPTGKIERKKPPRGGSRKGFAFKLGGHKISLGVSPWNHTFEPDFAEVDNIAPPVLKRIASYPLKKSQWNFLSIIERSEIEALLKFSFSLLIRSPAFRHRYSNAGASFGLGYNEETGKANISHFWKPVKSIDFAECNSYRLLFLHAKDVEFCYGDGLFDTLFTRQLSWFPEAGTWIADLNGEALVPLLPNLCAYLYFGREIRSSTAKVIQVTPNVVDEINHHTQIYSKNQLFFRALAPNLSEEYVRNEHMKISRENAGLMSLLRSYLD